jgi:hypothetical protein
MKIMAQRTPHNSTYDAFGTLENTTGRTENSYLFGRKQLNKGRVWNRSQSLEKGRKLDPAFNQSIMNT